MADFNDDFDGGFDIGGPDFTFKSKGITDAPRLRVFTKPNWTADWHEEPFLYCDFFEETASPLTGQAQFTWRYGNVLHPGKQAYAKEPASTLIGFYVKIVLSDPADASRPPRRWIGTFVDVRDLPIGSPRDADNQPVATGRQSLAAVDLSYLMDREFITSAWYLSPSDGEKRPINRAVEFNRVDQKHAPGNRSYTVGSDGLYLFTGDPDQASTWSSSDIVKYLVKYHVPRDPSGANVMGWKLAGAEQLFQHDVPRVQPRNRSVKNVLDHLIDRKRFQGYAIDIGKPSSDEFTSDEYPIIRVFGFNHTALTYGGENIPLNANQTSLDVSQCPNVSDLDVHETSGDFYAQVIVVGDRPISCFTISGLDQTLAKQWTDAEATAYNQAASTDAGYASLDTADKDRRNCMWRVSHKTLRAYKYFGLKPNWDGYVKDGEAGEEQVPWLPTEADADVPRTFYQLDSRFERALPLRAGYDYTGSNIGDGNIPRYVPTGEKFEYLTSIVMAKQPNADQTYDGLSRYAVIHDFGVAADIEFAPRFSASVRVQEDAPGLVIIAQPFAHLIAKADYTAPDASGANPDWYGAIDWHDNLICTVAMRADESVQAKYPDDDTIAAAYASDPVPRLIIDVGNQAQLQYVAPHTVVGVKDGNLQRSDGGYLVDDRPKLQELSEFAYNWYASTRRIVHLDVALVIYDLHIGDLLTKLDGVTLNTCVTRMRFVFDEEPSDTPPPPRTLIETAYAALDGRALLGAL